MKKLNDNTKSADREIKIGIDLGTTNSEIAINHNGSIEIVKNAMQDEYTPSVFGFDKSGNRVVGKKAYSSLFKSSSEDESENYKAEIKRLMGTSQKKHFKRANLEMTPEEISAEILKSLKESILKKYPNFDTSAAVITVPAYFSALQAEATKRAGELAGFEYVVLLQEPIAAAIAYGFDNAADENWLVYDLGGGTFDVALISSKNGLLTVLGHNGNNFLGGKDFDNLLIDNVIREAIIKKYKFENFDRDNPKYTNIFTRLKEIAETAKKELSQDDKTTVDIYEIGKDDTGEEINLSLELKRSDFEKLIEPKIKETIELSHKTIKEAGVLATAINKIILVGGPTQIPFLRDKLEKEFKASVDTSVDPLTIVAKGACIFGLSQQIPEEIAEKGRKSPKGELKMTINFESLTSDEEQFVTGTVEELKDSGEDFYIQIQSDTGFYTSSKIPLKKGTFSDEVAIETRKTNLFWIYLFDGKGNPVPAHPDSFSITNGLTPTGVPLPHTYGVIYSKKSFANNFDLAQICDPFFEKNSVLPLKRTEPYKTLEKLLKGQDNNLNIQIYEGESLVPDRNKIITKVIIDGKTLPHDLPEGSEVDITINIDESRSISVTAYVPSIEKSFNARADVYAQEVDTDALEKELGAQKERITRAKATSPQSEIAALEDKAESVTTSLKNSALDVDEQTKAERDLKELQMRLDEIETERALPQLEEDFKQIVNEARGIIDDLDDELKIRAIETIEALVQEGAKAIENEDKVLLVRVIEQIRELKFRSLFAIPAFWVWQLDQIKQSVDELSNQQEGAYFIEKADNAVSQGDVAELERCVRGLWELLPKEAQEEMRSNISGITK